MKNKGYIDGLADDLLKKKEASDKLRSLAGRASGLTAFLVNKTKEVVLRTEAIKKLPELKVKLEEKKQFFDRKKTVNDNSRVLGNEIKKCDEYYTSIGEKTTLEDLRIILDWYYKISEKYGF